MAIHNFTPHTINVIIGEDKMSFPSEGVVRALTTTTPCGVVDSIPVCRVEYGEPEGLPEYREGDYIIVSSLAAQAVKKYHPERDDILIPNGFVRDEAGNIIGCSQLAKA